MNRVLGFVAPSFVIKWVRRNFLSSLVGGAAVVTLLPFLLLGFVNSPMADDFWYGTLVHQFGLLDSQVEWYYGWTGRYGSTALISAYIWATDLGSGLMLLPFITLLAIYAAVALLIVSYSGVGPRRAAFGALVLLAVYVANMPRPASGLYWLSGAGIYPAGAVLFLFLSSALVRLSKESDDAASRILLTITCCVLSVLVVGTNELAMLSVLFLCSLALMSSIWGAPNSRLPLAVIMIVSLIATFATVSAPGNKVRSGDALFVWGDVVPALAASVFEGIQTLITWSLNSTVLALTLLFVIVVLSDRAGRDIGRAFLHPWVVPAYWLVLLLIHFFPTQLVFGIAPPDRALNAIYLLFLVGWFSSVFVIVRAIDAPKVVELPTFLVQAGCVVLAVGLLCQGNVFTAAKDIVLRAPTHARELEDRSRRIVEARAAGLSEVVLPPFTSPPYSTWIWDIGVTREHWSNRYFAAFYGFEGARIEGRGDQGVAPGLPEGAEDRALDFLK